MAGVLAWYSIIHVPPARLDAVLAEFCRVLMPGHGFGLDPLTRRKPQGRERTPQAFLLARKGEPSHVAAAPA